MVIITYQQQYKFVIQSRQLQLQQMEVIAQGQIQWGGRPIPPRERPVPPRERPVPLREHPVPPGERPVPPREHPVPPGERPVPPREHPVPPGECPVPPGERPVPPRCPGLRSGVIGPMLQLAGISGTGCFLGGTTPSSPNPSLSSPTRPSYP